MERIIAEYGKFIAAEPVDGEEPDKLENQDDVAAAEAQPGSGITKTATGDALQVMEAARTKARGNSTVEPTDSAVLDALGESFQQSGRPEAANGLAAFRGKLGDASAKKALDARLGKGEDLGHFLTDQGMTPEARTAARAHVEAARVTLARAKLIELKINEDPHLRARVKEDLQQLSKKLTEKKLGLNDEAAFDKAVKEHNITELVGEIAEAISRMELKADPANAGRSVLSNIEIVREVPGHKTIASWKAAEQAAGRPGDVGGLYEHNGKLWKSITEVDNVVVEKGSTGKLRIVDMEQVKAGGSHAAAAGQNTKAMGGGSPRSRQARPTCRSSIASVRISWARSVRRSSICLTSVASDSTHADCRERASIGSFPSPRRPWRAWLARSSSKACRTSGRLRCYLRAESGSTNKMPYTFIAAIADGSRIGDADYRDWVRVQLGEHGFTLTKDGELLRGDDLVGSYRFIDKEEGGRLLPVAARPLVEKLEPYSGPVVGFFSWTHAADQQIAEAQLLPAIVSISRSVIARTDNGRYRTAVSLVELPLSNLVGTHGFSDGEALLGRDEGYLRYVQREAEEALTAAGLSGHVGRFETHHNPIRLTGDLRMHERIVDDPEDELSRHTVKIWAYDPAIFKDLEFWLD